MKTLFKKLMLTATMICCSILFAVAQGNFVIEGDVIIAGSGGVGKPNWPVGIRLIGTTNTDIIYTDANGHYSLVIQNGAVIGPNKCWEVSTRDTCTPGAIVYFQDTVCNNQGTVTFGVVNFEIGRSCSCGSGFQFTLNGQVAAFTAYATGTAPFTYQWNFGDGSSGTGGNVTHTYAPGNYRACLLVIDANGCQSDFCDSVHVANTNVCEANFTKTVSGTTVAFNNTSTYFGGSASYVWSFGDGDSSTVINPTHTYNAPGTYQVCLKITTPNNCTDTYCQSITITTSSINCEAAFSHLMQGDTVYFTNNSVPVTQAGVVYVSYLWTFGDGTSSADRNPKKVYANYQTYPVCLKITVYNANQSVVCVDSVCQAVMYYPLSNQCDANFTSTVSTNGLVAFNNTSSYAPGTRAEWFWTFGNGDSSYVMSPSHQYTTAGTYNVCLRMYVYNLNNVLSCADSICKTVVVQGVPPHCDAAFTAHPVANNRVEFANNSVAANPNATTYTWTYGDGTSATGFAPDHIYTAAGTYFVCLYMYDQSTNCRDTLCKTVIVGQNTPTCTAYLTYNIGTLASPFVVYFTDASVSSTPNDPIVSWFWNFGDSTTSTTQNNVHTYTTPGQYVVCLTITTLSGCTNTVCKAVNLISNTTCNADFTYTGVPGPTIAFTNTSNQGGATATYRWTFGDNTSSTDQNPVHVYANPGQYRVCLVITTANGCVDDICKYVTIGTTVNCEAAFTAHVVSNNRVEFANNSVSANPNATSYKWTFGDGTASTLFAPDHIYQAPGTYTVCLYMYDQQSSCRDTLCKQVVIVGSSVPQCDASFAYTVISNRVEFRSTSVPALNTTSHFWTFGDGTTSTQVNPQHIFANPGTYTVCLTIINSLNGCTDDVCHTIVIGTNQTQFCLSGRICKGINSNAAYPAYVYLIYYDSIQGTLTAVRTTGTNQNGEYEFCNVPQGKYLVKAALSPNAPDYRNYLPTYYGNSLFWSYGIQVLLNQNRQQIDICLIAGNNNGGPGFVGGYVQQGANKTGNFAGDALVGVQVMLLDLNDNPLQYTYSDEQGRFTFDDLAYGTYKVYAEVLDKTTIPYLVTIGPDETEKDNILLLVESLQVVSGVENSITSTIQTLRLYPNPVSDMVYLELSLKDASAVNITVTDITGKTIVEEILNGVSGNQTHRISMSTQMAGIYFVRIAQGDVNKTIKVMKY